MSERKKRLDGYVAAREHLAELEAVFDLRWRADMRAIKAWQAAHPGKELVWPDHADLVVWLMERREAEAPLEAEIARLRKIEDAAREHGVCTCEHYPGYPRGHRHAPQCDDDPTLRAALGERHTEEGKK